MPRYNPLLDAIAEYPFEPLDRLKARLAASGQRVFDFTKGDPVEPAPALAREALIAAVSPHCPYPKVRGRAAIRQAIAGYLQRRFEVTVDPDTQLLPTSGAKEAVFHLPLLVIDPAATDRVVLFPDPGYPACARGALFAGGESVAVPLTGDHVFRPWELPVDLLQRTRLLWINTPHNPSGAVTGLDDLARTAEVCAKYDILLASDETYADIYTPGQPPPPSSPVPIAAIAVTNRSRVSRTVCATTSTSSRVTLAPFARLKCTRMSDDDFNGARSIDRRSRRRDARGETTRDENRRGTTTTSVRSRVRGLARSRARASAGHAPTVAIGSRGRPRHVTDGDETIQVYIP